MSDHIITAKEYEEEPAYKQLLERHHLETYDDYAGIIKMMSEAVKEMLDMPEEDDGGKDDVEKNNLKILSELLPICSDLFINCDPYYRR